ncbi:MAG TPA: hypothetical protein VN921_02995 [Chthoniobacterales bacterium]|nr:hypothetical protein [Chthoniobacterales bacterium]
MNLRVVERKDSEPLAVPRFSSPSFPSSSLGTQSSWKLGFHGPDLEASSSAAVAFGEAKLRKQTRSQAGAWERENESYSAAAGRVNEESADTRFSGFSDADSSRDPEKYQ